MNKHRKEEVTKRNILCVGSTNRGEIGRICKYNSMVIVVTEEKNVVETKSNRMIRLSAEIFQLSIKSLLLEFLESIDIIYLT